jgi:hypothetical protein
LGYNLGKTIVFGPHAENRTHRLRQIVEKLDAAAVIVPGVEHFDGNEIPTELVAVADIIAVSPENTYARTAAKDRTMAMSLRHRD